MKSSVAANEKAAAAAYFTFNDLFLPPFHQKQVHLGDFG